MNTIVLDQQTSILHQFLLEIRDRSIQLDSMRFRRNMERIGEIMAYEISKTLPCTEKEVTTPLGIAKVSTPEDTLVLATILRAGLPFHQGFLNYFDSAECAFLSAYRHTHKDYSFEIRMEYMATPNLEGKTLILIDPMIATGSSIEIAYKALIKHGIPKRTYIAGVISSIQGIQHVRKSLPASSKIYTASLDNELTAKSYIVPGLGDAGDLAFGSKNH